MSRGDRVRLFGGVLLVAALIVAVWSLASPLLIGWPLCLYVCWRAWPAVRSDVEVVRRRFFPARQWRI